MDSCFQEPKNPTSHWNVCQALATLRTRTRALATNLIAMRHQSSSVKQLAYCAIERVLCGFKCGHKNDDSSQIELIN